MILSRKVKESIKTAMAMTIAYGIALQADWDKPMWAGFAVAFVSLATVGQSLDKAALRMFGTMATAVVSLIILALFAQDRWLFILTLSIYVGFCAYMAGGTKNQYFWVVCGFVSVIICLDAGTDSAHAFQIALLRVEQTGLGILIYTLVAMWVWPTRSQADFAAATGTLATTQRQLYQSYLKLMKGQGPTDEAQALRGKVIQGQARFNQLLAAAEIDSYEVWELRQSWSLYQSQVAQLSQTMERWRECFPTVQVLDLQRLLPNLEFFGNELDQRMAQLEGMLAGQLPDPHPIAMNLAVDLDAVQELTHFQKAALAVTRNHLQHLEQLTRALFDSVSAIKGFSPENSFTEVATSSRRAGFVIDLDRLQNAYRFMVIFWLAFLAHIYVNDIPGGLGFVTFAAALGINLVGMPQVSATVLWVPAGISILFAGLLYIFVMPQLSSFMGLGLVIFTVTFIICYLFSEPQQMLGRALGLAMFLVIASVSNEQTYSFLSVSTTALMFVLVCTLLIITRYFPLDMRPESVFLSLLGRYFRSCDYLVSSPNQGSQKPESRLVRWKMNFHVHEVSTLPEKLGSWVRVIDTQTLADTSQPQVQALVTSLQALTNRIRELLESRGNAQAEFLVQELIAEGQAWRDRLQETFRNLSENPAVGERATFRARLDEILGHMEERVKAVLDKATAGQVSDREGEKFYNLLGAYRGVSEALVDYAGASDVIDWKGWREERF